MTCSIARFPIKDVVIYSGHLRGGSFVGPYSENVAKRVKMFSLLNRYREEISRPSWTVSQIFGHEITQALKTKDPKQTLLVIPAGQSTHLDEAFSDEEIAFLQADFFENQGRIYCNCGSAYWTSFWRKYTDLCTIQPTEKNTVIKVSRLPLFSGTAQGPLCPHLGKHYQVGFFHDAVTVNAGRDSCTILLSGGGTFIPQETDQTTQVLITYKQDELRRLQRSERENIAAILTRFQKGAALLSIFHPYYGPQDIDVERYEKAFPDSGTNWGNVCKRLSSEEERMRFILRHALLPLEDIFGSVEKKGPL